MKKTAELLWGNAVKVEAARANNTAPSSASHGTDISLINKAKAFAHAVILKAETGSPNLTSVAIYGYTSQNSLGWLIVGPGYLNAGSAIDLSAITPYEIVYGIGSFEKLAIVGASGADGSNKFDAWVVPIGEAN